MDEQSKDQGNQQGNWKKSEQFAVPDADHGKYHEGDDEKNLQ